MRNAFYHVPLSRLSLNDIILHTNFYCKHTTEFGNNTTVDINIQNCMKYANFIGQLPWTLTPWPITDQRHSVESTYSYIQLIDIHT